VKVFRKNNKTGIGRLPEYGVFGIIPGKDPLLIRGKEHPGGKVASDGNDVVFAVFRVWKIIAGRFGKIGKIRIRS
jgi:hypothetical protein